MCKSAIFPDFIGILLIKLCKTRLFFKIDLAENHHAPIFATR